MTEKPHTKFNELTNKQKVEHIMEYYKFHIIGGILIAMFVFWMLNHYIFNPPPTVTLDVSLFGHYANQDVVYDLEDELLERAIPEGVNESVLVDGLPIAGDTDAATQQATIAKIYAKAELKDFDIMFFGTDIYDDYMQGGALMPLNNYIEQGIIDVPEDLLIKGSDLGYESEEYYFIDVSDFDSINKLMPNDEVVYMALYHAAAPLEQVEIGLKYILEEFDPIVLQ